MNTQQLAQVVCNVFALGTPVAEPQVITGGLLHHMWRLETTQATFAVKELNPEIMSRPTARKNYLLSERIAAAFQAEHLPAIAALQHADGPLLDIGSTTVMVFPWIDGETLSPRAPKLEYVHQIGMLLGRIHRLNLSLPELHQPDIELISPTQWMPLVKRVSEKQLSCAGELLDALPDLLEWSTLYNQSAEILHRTLVVSHRDLDQKNVLWHDGHPLLIDWEAAGLINPTFEAINAALNWSGQTVGEPQQETLAAFLQSYRSAGGVIQVTGRDALHGCLGSWLNWLYYNIRRALGELALEPAEQALGLRETISTLSILRSLSCHIDTWAMWVDENG